MKSWAISVLVGTLALSATAGAAGNGYAFFGGGTNSADEEVVSFGPAGNMRTDSGSSGTFWTGGLGYALQTNLRVEAELGYRTNPIDGVTLLPTVPPIAGIGIAGADGDIEALSLLVNAWYDIPVGKRWGLMLGGGIGAAQVSIDNYTLSTFPIVPSPPITTALYADDDDWVFAYQAGVGVNLGLTERLYVDLTYRYFATSDAEFRSEAGNAFEANLNDSRLLLTLRYAFD